MPRASQPGKPVTVYLDSSDFSTLSTPKRLTEDLSRLRANLLALARSDRVRFVFSGVHVSEMAPVEPHYTPSAAARADLLVELCGRTAVISFDRLMAQELGRLADPAAPPVEAISEDATWFPEIGTLILPTKVVDALLGPLMQELKAQGLNHDQRRGLRRVLFREGKPKSSMKKLIAHVAATTDLSEILQSYPMHPALKETLWRYVLGHASAEAANAAFMETLRNPGWMMRWFEAHHERLSPVIAWARQPARELLAQLQAVAEVGVRLTGVDRRTLQHEWHAMEDGLLVRVVNTILVRQFPGAPPCDSASVVDRRSPGLSTAIRTLFAVIRDSIREQPRAVKSTDCVDALHAMYAPYVDHFRADKYMAGHIQPLVAPGTVVVGRLLDLPGCIRDVLARPGAGRFEHERGPSIPGRPRKTC